MKIIVGSYEQGIFEVSIENDRFNDLKQISDVKKASYLINNNNLSYIYLKDNVQYAKINNKDVLLNEGACHISYDNKNKLYYTSFYGDGLFKIIKDYEVIKTFSYGNNSHIHYAEYLPIQDLVGVVDLGLNNIHFYRNLNLVKTYHFDKNYGPRHFVSHNTLPIIYVISELIPTVFVFKVENDEIVLLDKVELQKGAGSAIRIDKVNKNLFAAVRDSNLLYHFEVLNNGLISLKEVHKTKGDHPRDFNLVLDDQYLVVANMNSNNLTLFKLENNQLKLLDSNFYLLKGATITSSK